MEEQKIALRKIRDFGDTFNDTFQFIRDNFKSLLRIFFAICGILMLVNAILRGYYNAGQFSFLKTIGQLGSKGLNLMDVFTPLYFVMLLIIPVMFLVMQIVITAFMMLYEEKGHVAPTIEEVGSYVIKYFFKTFLFSIPKVLLLMIGTLFCLLPGIFLWVVFAPLVPVIMIEDGTFSESFRRCFDLVRDHFWQTLGLYLIAYLIYSFSGGIISLIVGLFIGLTSYFTTHDVSVTAGIVTSVLSIFSYIFYIVFYVAVVLQYYNLAERRDGTGLLKRIDSIGDKPSDSYDNSGEY